MMIDRTLNTGGFSLPYKIINKNTGESKRMDVTEKDLVGEYGKIQKPKPMFVKDLAFKRGLFSLRDVTHKQLSTKRVYR